MRESPVRAAVGVVREISRRTEVDAYPVLGHEALVPLTLAAHIDDPKNRITSLKSWSLQDASVTFVLSPIEINRFTRSNSSIASSFASSLPR